MKFPMAQIDAFAETVFEGNPAAVIPLPEWPADKILQMTAQENNLSETAFLVGGAGHYHLRWFTPKVEIDLCGHGTLASAFYVFTYLEPDLKRVVFATKSGDLTVDRDDDGLLRMDFPAVATKIAMIDDDIFRAFGCRFMETTRAGDNFMFVAESPEIVADLKPDLGFILYNLDCHGVIVTAEGGPNGEDFVSRFFAPRVGVAEDPVTGSAHCALAPFWGKRLGKDVLNARQVSWRGGNVRCTLKGDRVELAGRCVTYLEGSVHIPEK